MIEKSYIQDESGTALVLECTEILRRWRSNGLGMCEIVGHKKLQSSLSLSFCKELSGRMSCTHSKGLQSKQASNLTLYHLGESLASI